MTASVGTVEVEVKPVVGEVGVLDNVEINYADADHIIGRLLTVVDATFSDPQQRKAQKDLVKREVRDWMDDLYRCKRQGIAHSRSQHTE